MPQAWGIGNIALDGVVRLGLGLIKRVVQGFSNNRTFLVRRSSGGLDNDKVASCPRGQGFNTTADNFLIKRKLQF